MTNKIQKMGAADFRKWADSWDPAVEVSKILLKVITDYEKAKELHRQDLIKRRQNRRSCRSNAKSARPRETYFDLEMRERSRRSPSKEEKGKLKLVTEIPLNGAYPFPVRD